MKQQLILTAALSLSSLASSVADVGEVDNTSNSVIAAEADSGRMLIDSDGISSHQDSSSSSITESLDNNDNTGATTNNSNAAVNDRNINPFANLNNNNPIPTRNLSTKFEERKKKRAEKIAARNGGSTNADGSVIAEAKSWKAPQNNGWQQPPMNSWQPPPPPPPPSWNNHGHWEQPKSWEAPTRSGWDEWSSRDWYKPPTWENPTWVDMPSGKSGKSNSLGARVGGGYSGKSGKSGGIEQGWHESGKGWHSSSDNWETPNDWWSPSYFMSPFSCGNMCIDAFDAAMIQRDDHKLSTAVVECNTEYPTQRWILHQNHDLVQVESYEYNGKCIAIHHDTDMDRSDIEEACNKGTLELTSCDHPASRWYFTGGQLLSFFCWSKGFSTNMAVVYNVTESQCDDELISTNEISGVSGNKPNTPKFCTNAAASDDTCTKICNEDSDCENESGGRSTCLAVPECIVKENGYCGSGSNVVNSAISNCEGDSFRDFQCSVNKPCADGSKCIAPNDLDGRCREHDFDVEYGDTFMFIEEKEMKMLYGDYHPSPSWTSPAWPSWSKPHDVPTRRRTAIPTKPGGGTGR